MSKTEGGGAHGLVGRPGRSAGLPVGPPTFLFVLWAALGAQLSVLCGLTQFRLVFFSGGPSDPCEARVTVFDQTASCSSSEKGMIALHFQLKPALIEI